MELREAVQTDENDVVPSRVAPQVDPVEAYIKKIRKWITLAMVIVLSVVMIVQSIKGSSQCNQSQSDPTSQLINLLNQASQIASIGYPSIGGVRNFEYGNSSAQLEEAARNLQ